MEFFIQEGFQTVVLQIASQPITYRVRERQPMTERLQSISLKSRLKPFISWNRLFSYYSALLSHRPLKFVLSARTLVRATLFIFWSEFNVDLYWSFNIARLFSFRLEVNRAIWTVRTHRKIDAKYR